MRSDTEQGSATVGSGPATLDDLMDKPAARTECRPPHATFEECPNCGGRMLPEHAHYRCEGCGWRDSCCD